MSFEPCSSRLSSLTYSTTEASETLSESIKAVGIERGNSQAAQSYAYKKGYKGMSRLYSFI